MSPFNIRFFLSQPLFKSDQRAIRDLDCRHTASIHINRTLRHTNGTRQTESVSIPWRLWWDLMRYRPAIVISGEMGARSVVSFFVSKMIGARFVVWTEEIESTAQGIGTAQRYLRRFLSCRSERFLAWGEPAVNYLGRLGVSRERITEVPQAADANFWRCQANAYDREIERKAFGISGTVFLFCGQLIERKGIREFLCAIASIKRRHPRISCIIAGDGNLSAEMKSFVEQERISNVYFTGQLDAESLARCYAMADVLVFPSLADVWGMVVNEALYFGLYIVGSIHAGACQQLLQESAFGENVDPANPQALEDTLSKIARIFPLPNRADPAALLHLLSPERAADGILEMLRTFGPQHTSE